MRFHGQGFDPEEEKRLNDDAYQDKMAEAIFSGIKKYFAKNPPLAKSTLARLERSPPQAVVTSPGQRRGEDIGIDQGHLP